MVSPILLIAVPLLLSFIAPLFREKAKYIPPIGMLFNLILSLILIPKVLKYPIIVSLGGFPPPFCINLVVDPLAILLSSLIALVGFLVSIYAISYIKERAIGRYHTLYLLLLTGATGIVLTGDIFNLFVFFEILCISSYALVAHNANWHRHGTESAVKYLIQGSIGASFILMGIGFIYGLFGTLNMADIAQGIDSISPISVFVPLVLLITGFGVEAAMFPLNGWLPDAHSASPAPISAILSGIAIKVGIYGMARVIFTIFNASSILIFITIMGLLTLLIGEMCAFRQDNIKRLSAYSSIGQVGLIIFALSLASTSGVSGGLFQIISHALSKSLLFLGVGYMIYSVRMKLYPGVYLTEINISSLNGLGKKLPLTSLAFTVGAFSLIGFPPFIGFPSKLLIVRAALEKGGTLYPLLIAIALVGTIIEGAYFLKVVQALYFKVPKLQKQKMAESEARHYLSQDRNGASEARHYFKKGEVEGIKEAPFAILLPMFALIVLIILIGIYPKVILPLLNSAAVGLLDKTSYIKAVLGSI